MSKPRSRREPLTPALGWVKTSDSLPPLNCWVLIWHEGLYSVAQLEEWSSDRVEWWSEKQGWLGGPLSLEYWRHLPVSPTGESGLG